MAEKSPPASASSAAQPTHRVPREPNGGGCPMLEDADRSENRLAIGGGLEPLWETADHASVDIRCALSDARRDVASEETEMASVVGPENVASAGHLEA